MIIYRKATINDDTAIANLLLERLPRDPLFVILGSNMTLKKFVPLMIKKAICLVAEEKISSRIIGVIILQNKNVNNFYFLKTIKIKDFFTIFFNSIKRKSVLLVLNAILFSIINLKKPGNLELLYIVVAKKMDRKNIGTCLVSESVINVQEECILWVKTLSKNTNAIKFYKKNEFKVEKNTYGRTMLSRYISNGSMMK